MTSPSDDDLTRSLLPTDTAAAASAIPGESPPRFAPGSILAGRYRLVTRLGAGAMGEVYRADDLTLDLPVALKFLPTAAGGDHLRRLHHELRIARQVSHRHVCRLYDIGEADGHPFLTMEYVDGEDLASLLRRIGRIPHDKAVQIARQVCAGIAAAHERGIVHRDLKPANVMIDGDGNVRIADFGIAVTVRDGGPAFAGTPHYMAPEQLAGQPATVQSDIYALGLILFEIFTGSRAVEGRTLAELQAFHRTTAVLNPSALVPDLDPAVERTIVRCLHHDPARRPGSALAVAVALPGGEPLAAALAAGDTPAPELLAAAGETEALRVHQGVLVAVLAIGGLLCFAGLSARTSIVGRVPLDLPPAVLSDRAVQILAALGHAPGASDAASGFIRNADYTRWLFETRSGPDRYGHVAHGDPSAVLFWYRTSPRPMQPRGSRTVTPDDPPMAASDDRLVVLDGRGRLRGLRVVPPQVAAQTSGTAEVSSWDRLFEAAGLSPSTYVPVEPQWLPPDYADVVAAWEGPMPGDDIDLRIEAGAYRGTPISLTIVGPWTYPVRMQPRYQAALDRTIAVLLTLSILGVFVAAAVLVRRNVRTSRADRRGAARLAGAAAALGAIGWLFGAHHPFSFGDEVEGLWRAAGEVAFLAFVLWMMYLAFEPFVRRLWPDGLLGWSRLLAGHVSDPRIGRDVLIGVTAGVALALVSAARAALIPALGYDAPSPTFGTAVELLAGPGTLIAGWSLAALSAIQTVLIMVALVVLVRLIVPWRWPCALATAATLGLPALAQAGTTNSSLVWVFFLASGAILAAVVLRAGLLAFAVTWVVWSVLLAAPMRPDPLHWSAAAGNWTTAAVVALAAFGFYAASASHRTGAGQPTTRTAAHT